MQVKLIGKITCCRSRRC